MQTRQLSFITAALLSLSSVAYAEMYDFKQLYKDPKMMGMGGANVAIGGQTSSLFSNPAGLAFIPKEYGNEIDLINASFSISEDTIDFANDMEDATDNPGDLNGDGIVNDDDETIAVFDVIRKYNNTNNHLGFSNFTSYGRKFEKVGFGIGVILGSDFVYKPSRGLSTDGMVQVSGIAYGGLATGMSYDFSGVELTDKYLLNDFAVGIGLKQIKYVSVDDYLTVNEIVDHKDDMQDYITDDLAVEGTSTVLDLGVIYDIYENFQAGVSILNIGGIGDDKAVEIPQTINVGVGYLKRWERHRFFNQVRVSADYIDLGNSYDGGDMMKRLRFGAETNAWDGWLSTMSLRGGMYQGYYTAGVDLRLSVLEVSYATYAEEMGAESGQDENRRHMFNLKIGW